MSVKTDKYGGVRQESLARKVQGLTTTGKTRDQMYNMLIEFVNEYIENLYSKYLVEDILNLIRKPNNGRIEAGPGMHDDNVMSFLFTIFVYRFAKNLYKYGIIPGAESPEAKAKRVETRDDIKRKIASVMGNLPEEYQELFQDYLDERDDLQDAREYAQQVNQEQRRFDRFAAATLFDEDDNPFDPDKIEAERQKNLEQGYYNYGPPGIGNDIPTDYDQEAFEKSIFDLNFQQNQEFNIDDYI